jgi:uncharacterized protein
MALPKITSAMLILTHACNLQCRYCFVSQENTDMSLQVALDAIDFLMKNNPPSMTCHVCFFGGEPLLKWDEIIVPTVEYKERIYPDRKITFSITTNCVLLTEDKIHFMKEHKIGILTSIDGAKDTQYYNRPFHNGA